MPGNRKKSLKNVLVLAWKQKEKSKKCISTCLETERKVASLTCLPVSKARTNKFYICWQCIYIAYVMPWYFIYHLVVFYIESREKSVELSKKSRKECCFNRFLSSVTYTLILLVWETIFFKHSPKWRVDWNKYSPKWNRARHV